MLSPELQRKVDSLWNKFWAGGLANPLMAIDQMNYLIFLKRLEDTDDFAASRAASRGEEVTSVFDGAPECRWSYWRFLPAKEMVVHVSQKVFPWMKNLAPANSAFTQYLEDAAFLIQKASLLVEAVGIIQELSITDRNVDTQGDIYEYMLSKLSVAGQIGQFRTPRHIIRAMVSMVNPQIGQSILDPAAGTGGFLIAAYQHMVAAGTSPEFITTEDQSLHGLVGDRLTADQWRWLNESSLEGWDFDPTMVRIAAMNMMLHGINRPRVHYGDPLSSSFSHAPRAQVILANPPFSGSIDTSDISKDFLFATKQTELLFVQLMEDLLVSGGVAAVIVPQGVLLGANDVQADVRKRLLDNNAVEAVISLPHFVFRPYASVATAILVFRKGGSTKRVWMYRVGTDGFSSGADRRPTGVSDLPDLQEQWDGRMSSDYQPNLLQHRWVSRQEIAEASNELDPSVYVGAQSLAHDFPIRTLGELCTIEKGSQSASKAIPGSYPLVTTAAQMKSSNTWEFEGPAVCIPLVSSTGHGHASINRVTLVDGKFAAATIVAVLRVKDTKELLPAYLFHLLQIHKDTLLLKSMRGAANVTLTPTKIGAVEIPVPPLREQELLINEIMRIDGELEVLSEQIASLNFERLAAVGSIRDAFQA